MTDRLSQLLDEVTRDVAAPDLASAAWARGRARRRRARLASAGASALTLVVIVGTGIAISNGRNDPAPQTSSPGAASSVPPANQQSRSAAPRLAPALASSQAAASASSVVRSVDGKILIAPTLAEEAALPLATSVLPPLITIPESPPTIAQDPMQSALALLQRGIYAGDEITGFELFALGSDHRVRRLDVTLQDTRDENGNKALPLRDTALRADGLRAVFAQPEEVVVVDLTTGTSTRHPVAGLNEGVRWHPDGLFVVVTRTHDSVLLDTRNGQYRRYGSLHDPAFTDDGQLGLEVRGANLNSEGAAAIVLFAPDGGTPLKELSLDPRLGDRWGAPWVHGALVAQDGWLRSTGITGNSVLQNPEAITVVDHKSGALIGGLAFADMGRNKGCCAVLGWLGGDTVVFQSAGRILAWNHRTGGLARLSELDRPITVSLAQLAK